MSTRNFIFNTALEILAKNGQNVLHENNYPSQTSGHGFSVHYLDHIFFSPRGAQSTKYENIL